MIPILQSTRSSRLTSSPLITDFRQGRTYKELIPYYEKRYSKTIHPVRRRSECDIQDSCTCPRCDAPKHFLYKNNGSKGQLLGIPQPPSGGEDMPRKSIDIRLTVHSVPAEKGQLRLFLPSGEDGCGQSPHMGQGTSPLQVLRATS